MKFAELSALYHQPFFDLMSQSRAVHLQHWRGEEVQRCSLLSIKTGGCSEDCAYCAQSAHYSTGLEREELLSLEEVMTAAHRARSQGATRFCMGAAWRGVRDGSEKFERVLKIVRVLSGNCEHAYISEPPRHHCGRAGKRYVRLLRRDHRHGGNRDRPTANAGGIEQPRSRSGKRADQLFNADAWHATGRSIASRHSRAGSFDCGNTNCIAEGASSPGSWAHPAFTRGSGTLFFRRRKFNFLRR